MNTLETNVQQGLIIGAGAFPEARPAAKEKLTKAASPAKLPYGMAPEDRKTAFFEQACYWTFMLVGAYSLIRAFVI
jgi:hypothetical protein